MRSILAVTAWMLLATLGTCLAAQSKPDGDKNIMITQGGGASHVCRDGVTQKPCTANQVAKLKAALDADKSAPKIRTLTAAADGKMTCVLPSAQPCGQKEWSDLLAWMFKNYF